MPGKSRIQSTAEPPDQQGDYSLWCVLGIIFTGALIRSPLEIPPILYSGLAVVGFLFLCSTYFRRWTAAAMGFLLGWNVGWLLEASNQGQEMTVTYMLAAGLLATTPFSLVLSILRRRFAGLVITLVAVIFAAGLTGIAHYLFPLKEWIVYILHSVALLAFLGCAGLTSGLSEGLGKDARKPLHYT